MNKFRIPLCTPAFALVVVWLTVGTWPAGPRSTAAQAVRPEITAAQPAPGMAVAVERWVESDRPHVAIHLPDSVSPDQHSPDSHSPEYSPDPSSRIRDAVTEWEMLLLGLGVPYTVIGSDDLESGLDRSIDVLIMPAATWSDDSDIRNAAEFAESGGGLVVAGVPHADPEAASILEELLGAQFMAPPEGTTGLYQIVHRLPDMPIGTPAGFRLNVAVRGSFRSARPVTSTALGPLVPYGSDSTGTLAGLTGALRASPGPGRVVWTAFMPQDVSDEIEQQLVWQRMAFGALVDAGGLPTLSVEAWPTGRPASLGIAVLPSPGHDPATMLRNTGHLIDVLERENLPATFFLPGSEVGLFPDLVRRIQTVGDFGITTRSGRPLVGQSVDVQRSRIREGAADVLAATGAAPGDQTKVIRSSGFLPPAWLVDGSTLQAVADEDFNYVLRTGGSSLMPDSVGVHDQVDFREADSPRYVPTLPVNGSFGSSTDGYQAALRAGGAFILPFRVEEIIPGSARFDAFLELISRARRDGVVFMSLSEMTAWDAARRAVYLDVREMSDSETAVTVTNSGDAAVSGLVLRWGPEGSAVLPSMNVSDSGVTVEPDPASGTVLLRVPDMPAGSTLAFRISSP